MPECRDCGVALAPHETQLCQACWEASEADDYCGCGMSDCPDCDKDCSWCGGDGYDECDDPIQCTRPHTKQLGLCPCGACGGTGRAKDQTVW